MASNTMKRKKQTINDELARMVRMKYQIASDANREAHQRALDCLNQIKGKLFDSLVDEGFEDFKSIQMNITHPIAMGFKAMLVEILDPIIAQPFTLEPSPIVDLPPDVAMRLRDEITARLPELVQMAEGQESKLMNLIDEFTEATRQYERESASRSAERLTTAVRDKLSESGFEKEFSDWLYNFVVYPLAIIKGPIYEMASKRKWGTFGLTHVDELVMKVRNISPFDFFPAPKAKDPHTCPYVIERMRVHAGQLIDMTMSDEGYDNEAINIALDQYASHIIPYNVGNSTASPDSDPDISDTGSDQDEGYYDLLLYYGRISGKHLMAYGVEVEDERRFYEAEVWVLNDYVIKAVLNPNDKGRRPFEVKAFSTTTGEMWGKSPVEIIRDSQRQCTVAGRALARNMEFASSPIGEVVSRNVLGEDDPQEIYPMMMRAVSPTVGGQTVYRFYAVPSLANELLGVYEKFYRIGFDLLGIPPIAFGDTQGSATLGRTSGGVAMVMNQASKAVKQTMASVEREITKPLIRKFVDEEMIFNQDISIRGDVEVQVNGVRSIADKEAKEGSLEWALQSLAPFAQGVQIPPEVIMRLIVELFEQRGISTSGLPSFDMIDAVRNDLAGQMPQQPTQGGQNPTGQLDGRSQVAINQIEGNQ